MSKRADAWPAWVIRGGGLTTILFASVGILLSVSTALQYNERSGRNTREAYLLEAFWAMTLVNAIFLCTLLVGGYLLLRLKRLGLRVCNAVFIAEMLYWVGIVILPTYAEVLLGQRTDLVALARSLGAASGTGNMGINLQIITAYPLLALVALNISFRRLQRDPQAVPAPSAQ